MCLSLKQHLDQRLLLIGIVMSWLIMSAALLYKTYASQLAGRGPTGRKPRNSEKQLHLSVDWYDISVPSLKKDGSPSGPGNKDCHFQEDANEYDNLLWDNLGKSDGYDLDYDWTMMVPLTYINSFHCLNWNCSCHKLKRLYFENEFTGITQLYNEEPWSFREGYKASGVLGF